MEISRELSAHEKSQADRLGIFHDTEQVFPLAIHRRKQV